MKYTYIPRGVCSRKIDIELDGETIKSVRFTGGCNGNTSGISALAAGKNVYEVINSLKGIDCNMRGTSCPDQLSKALQQAIEKE